MGTAQKKFGTFAGVFTPSLLTILGVIMYMRLGWVVGQAGLIATIGIILIAHIISISTGLSISSIATDKKIKTGGIYYMLSRSLGLPMGGSIGLTLFVGTALSISLYIIGFAENFLSIQEIQNFIGLEPSIDSLRIIGTAVIIFLVVLAFISTSLAIKSQFFILGAIFLSLISIGVGLVMNNSSGGAIHYQPFTTHEPLALVFAIFFPAVTGFTAGVAMSGDLKDPKKNIPRGTLFAILVGLVVYLGMAISFAFFVDPNLLATDTNILITIAWSAPLVIAGIWGATLSSALGGILGGPRILQAMSKDKITPKLFGKGYGINNEPRNALLLTFLIAEGGILIGELDVIARVVSMFYIAAYGFINISYSLEKWTSSDFRPSFKIPIWVGIIGFIACFFVMFSIDFVAMIAAIIVIMLVYFLLKRREFKLDFGDVWHSAWASVGRTSLHRMDQKEIEQRNWRPNILLFSNDEKQRPFLMQVGKYFVGKHGYLSNFDLIENESSEVLFPKSQQAVISEESQNEKGVFTRKQSCRNFYEGVEVITQTYVFSGIVPNTTLLGWSTKQKDPARFIKTLKTINELDMNILLMDYDYKRCFAKKENIDIWWRGSGQNGNLALTLSRFLLLNDDWQNAKVRLIVVNPENSQKDYVRGEGQKILDNLRLDAELRIINNQVEKKEIFDLVRTESVQADLIFVGLPEIEEGFEQTFIDDTNRLCEDVGTIIFVKASSYFNELGVGVQDQSQFDNAEGEDNLVSLTAAVDGEIPKLEYPTNAVLNRKFRNFSEKHLHLNQHFFEKNLLKVYKDFEVYITDIENRVDSHFEKLGENLIDIRHQEDHIGNYLFVLTNRLIKLNIHMQQEIIPNLFVLQKQGLSDMLKVLEQEVQNSEEWLYCRVKSRKGSNKTIKIPYRKLLEKYYPLFSAKNLNNLFEKHRLISMQFQVETQKFIKQLRVAHLQLAVKCHDCRIDISDLEEHRKLVNEQIAKLRAICTDAGRNLNISFLQDNVKTLQDISDVLNQPQKVKYAIRSKRFKQIAHEKPVERLPQILPSWKQHQELGANIVLLQLTLLKLHLRLKNLFREQSMDTHLRIKETLESHYDKAIAGTEKFVLACEKGKKSEFSFEQNDTILQEIKRIQKITEQILYKLRPVLNKLPESIQLMSGEVFNNYNEIGFKEAKTIKLSVSRLIDYIIQNEILEPMEKSIAEYSIELGESYSKVQMHLRFIAFTSESIDNKDGQYCIQIRDRLEELKQEKEKLKKINTRFNLQVGERMNATAELLSVSKFIKTAANIKQYVKVQESRKRKLAIASGIEVIRKRIRRLIDLYWYNQSKGAILARKLREASKEKDARVNDLLNIYDRVKPDMEILNKLPYYYLQLFSNKTHYGSDLWIGRDNELAEAKRTIERHRNGYTGAVLVLGAYNSGKSFLSQHIARKLYETDIVYTIMPPHEGSISLEKFRDALAKTAETDGEIDTILDQIPQGSALIIDDLELWWEKSPDGYSIIERIIEIISKYSQRFLIIINANANSFNLINKLKKIESHFLNIIECGPFDASVLEQIVLQRHQSSNLKLKIRQQKKSSLSLVSQPKFFARMFNFSKGNIGVALNTWLANIYEFDNQGIGVLMPKQASLHKLDHLGNDWYLLLMQFLLHKRLTIEKLQRITWEDPDVLFNKLMILKRAALIVEDQNHVFELNPYMHIHIAHKLQEKEMI
ncbi:MAG: amino acid permease [Bacteroidales bacterium]|nr:amino acid permease [Bacteroidales bacterium]